MPKRKQRTPQEAVEAVIAALERGEYLRSNKASRDTGKTWDTAHYLDDLRDAAHQLGGVDEAEVETTNGVTGEYADPTDD